LVAAIGSAGFAAGSFVAGRLGNFDLRMLFSVTMALSGLLIAPVYLDQTGVVSSTLLVTLSIFMGGIGGVAMLNLLANHTPIGQATTLVFNESVFSFGAATGAAGGGLAISLQGFGALSLLLPLLGLAGGLLVWRPGIPVAAGTRAD
jgi:predicted MFS family arabinose efflux permease